MLTTIILAPLMLAQPVTDHMVQQERETREVAYQQIADGEFSAALEQLELALAEDPSDPATLINLGSVHQQIGNREQAELFYRAALESETRYDMELAGGRWLDSRRVASLALQTLERPQVALR